MHSTLGVIQGRLDEKVGQGEGQGRGSILGQYWVNAGEEMDNDWAHEDLHAPIPSIPSPCTHGHSQHP